MGSSSDPRLSFLVYERHRMWTRALATGRDIKSGVRDRIAGHREPGEHGDNRRESAHDRLEAMWDRLDAAADRAVAAAERARDVNPTEDLDPPTA